MITCYSGASKEYNWNNKTVKFKTKHKQFSWWERCCGNFIVLWRPFCPGLNALIDIYFQHAHQRGKRVHSIKFAHGFVLLCFIAVISYLMVYSYSSVLLHWHWSIHIIVLVPAKILEECGWNGPIPKHSKTGQMQHVAYFMGYCLQWLWCLKKVVNSRNGVALYEAATGLRHFFFQNVISFSDTVHNKCKILHDISPMQLVFCQHCGSWWPIALTACNHAFPYVCGSMYLI